jgi:hypothetical protein
MAKAKPKTWKQKAAEVKPGYGFRLEKSFAGTPAGKTMFVPDPLLIDRMMAAIPSGQSKSLAEFRREIAQMQGTDATCPVTTAIYARIMAEAALEELAGCKTPAEITPFWRVIDENSTIAPKLSCGVDFIRTQRELERV